MKLLLTTFFLISYSLILGQQIQINDPYPTLNINNEIKFRVDKYFPIFGLSEKPFTNEKFIKLTDIDGIFIAYLFFKDQYTPPKYDKKAKTIRLFFPDSYYNYIIQRLEKEDAYIVYREYKEGHNWGEIYFDKYP